MPEVLRLTGFGEFDALSREQRCAQRGGVKLVHARPGAEVTWVAPP